MRSLRPLAVLTASLTTATVLTVPAAQAQPSPISSGSCEISLTTSATIPTSDGEENEVAADGIMAIGLQNYVSPTTNVTAPEFRPWLEMRGEAGRYTTDTKVAFEVDGPEGAWTVRPFSRGFGSVVTDQIPVTQGTGGNFTADADTLHASTETVGALWVASGPPASLRLVPEDDPATERKYNFAEGYAPVPATLTASTVILPFPGENTNCQPIELDDSLVSTIAAGEPEDTGAVVTGADTEDYSRLRAEVFVAGTEDPVPGATASIDPVTGEISVELPRGFDGSNVDVRVTAAPHDDVPAGASANYRAPEVIGTVTVPVGEPMPGSSVSDRCVATAGGLSSAALLVAPLALATEVNIPGLTPVVEQAEAAVKEINNRVQMATGTHDPRLARLAEEVNLGAILGSGAALAALIGLISVCSPGSSEGSSLGSSGSSQS